MSDLYITDSMQDMLDIDIKSEVATVVGGVNEFVSLMNYDLPSLELDSNSLDGDCFFSSAFATSSNDLYPDVGTCANPNYVMPVLSAGSILSASSGTAAGAVAASSTMSALVAAQSLLKSPKQNLNLNTTVHGTGPNPTLPSPKERKSHLTFSPNTIKVSTMHEAKKISSLAQITRVGAAGTTMAMTCTPLTPTTPIEHVRKDLSAQMSIKEEKIIVRNGIVKSASDHLIATGNNVIVGETIVHRTSSSSSSPGLGVGLGKGNTVKLGAGIGALTYASSVPFKNLKSVQKITGGVGGLNGVVKRESSPHRQLNGGGASSPKTFNRSLIIDQQTVVGVGGKPGIVTVGNVGSPTAMVARQVQRAMTPTGTKQKQNKAVGGGGENEYPKPAYSYSCLIAMALKNSRSGSLPVSEIYSFMCEHFPYFKTAPTGWKNSVRHNLSLNKCFEKIEKPATNGGQRKGCLWAMNPAKITKMDEEVQKWSRKDPLAIRRAMVYPENLEALERGEMKHGSTGDDDLDPEEDLESDGGPSDVDAEEVDEEAVEDPDEEEEEEEEDEEDDDVELIEQPQETIDVDAESFIINTPESLIDGDEDGADQVDFDLEVPDFYENINVDSKDSTLALEFTQQDLLSLEDEDESLYINQLQQQTRLGAGPTVIAVSQHQHQQQQLQLPVHTQIITQHHRQQQTTVLHQPPAKRARLETINYTISSGQQQHGGLVNVISARQPTTTLLNGGTGGNNTVTVTPVNGNTLLGMSFQQHFQQQSTLQHQQQQLRQQQQQQQGNIRRKIPMVTRLV
uniref:Fork-head domain-containing protein n=1 Tax=Anopheles dirus TaxID=7168 RepID=A0A182N6S7_9DIPT